MGERGEGVGAEGGGGSGGTHAENSREKRQEGREEKKGTSHRATELRPIHHKTSDREIFDPATSDPPRHAMTFTSGTDRCHRRSRVREGNRAKWKLQTGATSLMDVLLRGSLPFSRLLSGRRRNRRRKRRRRTTKEEREREPRRWWRVGGGVVEPGRCFLCQYRRRGETDGKVRMIGRFRD